MSSDSPPSHSFIVRSLTVIGLVLLVTVLGLFLWRALDVFLVIFAGILLGIFLYSLSNAIAGWTRIGYAWCLTGVATVLFGGAAIFVASVVPEVGNRVGQLTEQLGEAASQLQQQVRSTTWGQPLIDQMPGIGKLLEASAPQDEAASDESSASQDDGGSRDDGGGQEDGGGQDDGGGQNDGGSQEDGGGQASAEPESGSPAPRSTGGNLLSWVSTIFRSTLGMLVNLVVIFFVGLYTAATPELYRGGLIKLIPPEHRERASEVIAHLRETLWRWILGRLFSMSVIGVATAIGLSLMGIPLPITLGVVTALLTFVPNIGPILSVVPPLLLALPQGPMMGVYVIVFFLVLELGESYLLTPLVQQYEISLPPALTISVQLLMGVVAGGLGLILATPLAAAAMVLINDLYIHDLLQDRD